MTKLRYLLPLLLLAGLRAEAQEAPAEGSAPGAAATQAQATTTQAQATEARGSGDNSSSSVEAKTSPEEPGVKTLSGMSILGNEEAPTSLVIVPWKSSRIGDEVGVANAMDDRARPVDREVFMREVHFYDLRTAGTEASQ